MTKRESKKNVQNKCYKIYIILMKNTIEQYESVHKISVLMAYAQKLLINAHADVSRVHTGKYE